MVSKAGIEADDFRDGADVGAAEVPIGIGGREAVEMGARDGGKEERARVGRGFVPEAGIDGEHGGTFETTENTENTEGLGDYMGFFRGAEITDVYLTFI